VPRRRFCIEGLDYWWLALIWMGFGWDLDGIRGAFDVWKGKRLPLSEVYGNK
jgi:hypothetical protein